MKLKKLFALVCAGALALSLAACGGGSTLFTFVYFITMSAGLQAPFFRLCAEKFRKRGFQETLS